MPLTSPVTATLGFVGSLFGLDYDDQLRALDTLVGKVGREVGPAAEKLAEALGEIDKMLTALDDQLVRYLELRFEPAEPARADVRTLLELEAGQAMVRIEEARGHCSRIELIYDVHLKRWIQDTLDPTGADALARIFTAMHDADLSVIGSAQRLNEFLMEHAEGTLDCLLAGDFGGANDLVRGARAHALDFRRVLFRELAALRHYEGAFVRAARAI